MGCLYKCGNEIPGTEIYHLYPASASNLEVLLETGLVCNKCNGYFSLLENYFITNHPGEISRLQTVKSTKKGKSPRTKYKSGDATRIDSARGSKFTYPLSQINYESSPDAIVFTMESERESFCSLKISRLLVKMAIESVVSYPPEHRLNPCGQAFDDYRIYARQGKTRKIPYVWFAWKKCDGLQKPPQVIEVHDQEKHRLCYLARLSLPGVAYLVPLPPICTPSPLLKCLDGWELCDQNKQYDNNPLIIKVPLMPVPVDQNGQMSAE